MVAPLDPPRRSDTYVGPTRQTNPTDDAPFGVLREVGSNEDLIDETCPVSSLPSRQGFPISWQYQNRGEIDFGPIINLGRESNRELLAIPRAEGRWLRR